MLKKSYTFAKILIKIINKTMKKLLTLVAVAGIFTFTACGPSEAEKKAAEQKIADSTAKYAADMAAAEAAKAQQVADSTKKAMEEAHAKMVADSTAKYEEDHKKGGAKKK
jgi:hypothetical protein